MYIPKLSLKQNDKLMNRPILGGGRGRGRGRGNSHSLGYEMYHFSGYFFGWKISFWVYFIACTKFLGQDFSLE